MVIPCISLVITSQNVISSFPVVKGLRTWNKVGKRKIVNEFLPHPLMEVESTGKYSRAVITLKFTDSDAHRNSF